MAWKIASSLKFHHLELAHKRKPDGNYVLFTEEHVGTDYDTLHEMTVPEKLVSSLKRATKKSVLSKGYTIKEDGTIRLTDTSTVRIIFKKH